MRVLSALFYLCVLLQSPAARAHVIEQLMREGAIWAKKSNVGESHDNFCPSYFRIEDQTQALLQNQASLSESIKPGDRLILIAGFNLENGQEISSDEAALRFHYRPPGAQLGTQILQDSKQFIFGVAGSKASLSNREESIILTQSIFAYSIGMFGSKREQLIFSKRNGAIQLVKEESGKATSSCHYSMVELPPTAIAAESDHRQLSDEPVRAPASVNVLAR